MESTGSKSVAEQALRLNVQYYKMLFSVTREYLSALRELAEGGLAGGLETKRAGSEREVPSTSPSRPPAAMPPLVLAATAGSVAQARFAVTNNTGRETSACPEISQELRAVGVVAEPARMQVAPGETAVFQLRVTVGKGVDAESDVLGHVCLPLAGDREIPVVLRRLPDVAPKRKARRKKPEKPASRAVKS